MKKVREDVWTEVKKTQKRRHNGTPIPDQNPIIIIINITLQSIIIKGQSTVKLN